MKKSLKNILVMALCGAISSSCAKPNVLADLSSQTSDAAYLVDAQTAVDSSQWDTAINIIENKMSTSYRNTRSVINLHAGAYAGKCGVNFASMVTGLKNASSSASQIFPFMVQAFSGITVSPASCESAITLLQSIGGNSSRTDDENLFLSILGIARIGMNLAAEYDTDHSGVADDVSNSDFCHEWTSGTASHPWLSSDAAYSVYPPPTTVPTYSMRDLEVQRVAAGIGLLIENSTALGNIIGPSNSVITAITSVTNSCSSVATALGLTLTCTETVSGSVSNAAIYGIRSLLDSSSLGFGTCTVGSTTAGQICCPTLKPPPTAPAAWP